MSSLSTALDQLTPSLEREIQPRLQGFVGAMMRTYLPQTWVFQGEKEVASLTVSKDGTITVVDHALPTPDVTIRAKEEILLAALTKGRAAGVHEKDFQVTTHTSKGRTAFGFLRQRFGL